VCKKRQYKSCYQPPGPCHGSTMDASAQTLVTKELRPRPPPNPLNPSPPPRSRPASRAEPAKSFQQRKPLLASPGTEHVLQRAGQEQIRRGRDPSRWHGTKKLCPPKRPSLTHPHTKLSSCHKQPSGWAAGQPCLPAGPSHCCTTLLRAEGARREAGPAPCQGCPPELPSTLTPGSERGPGAEPAPLRGKPSLQRETISFPQSGRRVSLAAGRK